MTKRYALITSLTAMLALGGGAAQATLYNYTFSSGFTGGTTVADGNGTGWTDNRTIGDASGGTITGVSVRLSTSGGYNGDMYGYLVLTDTSTHAVLGMSVLINRVGTGSGSEPQTTFGFDTAGFSGVTFSDGAASSIHSALDPTGGTYLTDGGSLGSFIGANANNTWTLFLADLSTGGVMQVDNWGLDIDVVPEPVTVALVAFMTLAGALHVVGRVGRNKQ